METIADRLGGREGVSRAVYALYERLVDDEATRHYFEDVDLPGIRAHMTDFLVAALTGRTEAYRGRPLDTAHAGLAIDDAAFDAVVQHLIVVLTELGVAADDIDHVVGRLAPLRPQIVS